MTGHKSEYVNAGHRAVHDRYRGRKVFQNVIRVFDGDGHREPTQTVPEHHQPHHWVETRQPALQLMNNE